MDIQKNHKEHMLKTDPAVFQDVLDGSKTFEIRFNDRGYQIGDLIVLKETKFTGQQMKSGQPLAYTGREIQKRISYVLGGYGLQDDWVILGVQDIEATKAQAAPEGFVLVPKKPDVDKAWSIALKRIVPPPKTNDAIQKELMYKKYVDDLYSEQDRTLLDYEAMIEAQEQSHDS